jgi:hypothetical protein
MATRFEMLPLYYTKIVRVSLYLVYCTVCISIVLSRRWWRERKMLDLLDFLIAMANRDHFARNILFSFHFNHVTALLETNRDRHWFIVLLLPSCSTTNFYLFLYTPRTFQDGTLNVLLLTQFYL